MRTNYLLLFALLMLTPTVSHSASRFYSITDKGDKYEIVVVFNDTKGFFLELSKWEDFSRVHYSTGKNAGAEKKKYTITIAKEDIYSSGSYLRIRDTQNNTFAYPDSPKMIKGTKPSDTTKGIPENATYDDFVIDENTSLQLKPLWYRSYNTKNHIYRCWDMSPNKDSTVVTFNHGMVVRDSIIYISRGTLDVSSWHESKEHVWIDRYNLYTGETMDFIRVKAPGGKYPDTNNHVMGWIREDEDSTVYFTNTTFRHTIFPKSINLYTVNLDNLDPKTESITATEAGTFHFEAKDSMDNVAFYTVKGSIKKKNYTLWGASSMSVGKSTSKIRMKVKQWNVNNSSVTTKYSYITKASFLLPTTDPETGRELYTSGILGKIYPVDNEHFYYHNVDYNGYDLIYSPMLYKFNDKKTCEIVGSLDNCPELINKIPPRTSGMAMFDIGDTHFLAYGIGTDEPQKRSSAVRIVSTPDYMDDFSNHKIAWEIGKETGFSSLYNQGVDVKYIPDPDPKTGGKLLVFVPKGGLALYRVNVLSSVVGIDNPTDDKITGEYHDGALHLSDAVTGVQIFDITGKLIETNPTNTDYIPMSHLPKGMYIVRLPKEHRTFKIAVK